MLLVTVGCERDDTPDATAETIRTLGALPYVSATPIAEQDIRERMGVKRHDPEAAFHGVTALCSEKTDDLRFLDMMGREVHRISVEDSRCRLVKPYLDDDFIILGRYSLLRVGWDGTVRWRLNGSYRNDEPGPSDSFHHDFAVTADGRILVLTHHNREVEVDGFLVPVRDDEITEISADGKVRGRKSLFDVLRPWIPDERLVGLSISRSDTAPHWGSHSDFLHVNTLELLPADSGLGAGADVLVAVRYLDLVAALDLDSGQVTWSYGPGQLEWPHHPTLLESGHILIFDNGSRRQASRVLELDPLRTEVVWQYRAPPDDLPFFTRSRGSAQLLPGGNVLITESATGRVFEITREGRTVWEYWNADVVKKRFLWRLRTRTKRRLVYRATRYHPGNLRHPDFLKLWSELGYADAGHNEVAWR